MGLFSKKKQQQHRIVVELPEAGAQPITSTQGGAINLTKGSGIMLTKSPLVTAKCTWPPATDYDVYALVLYRDGHVETVSTFGTSQNPTGYSAATRDGAVKHTGDVGRSSDAMASETVEVRLNPEVMAVVPVVYSAQSNGSGSFRRYQVGMTLDNGAGQQVQLNATNASDSESIYSCIPGVILNAEDGVRIDAIEAYSRQGSENRPELTIEDGSLVITMDAGPVNAYK